MIWIGLVILIFTFTVTMITNPETGKQCFLDAVTDVIIAAALLGIFYGAIQLGCNI